MITFKGLSPLLQVFDMRRSIRFYCDQLGFEIQSTSEEGDDFDWALLRQGDIQLMLNTAYERHQRPPSEDLARVAAHADTILYFWVESVDEVSEFLNEQGVQHRPPIVTDYGMQQLYCRDPDGYELCFQHAATSASSDA